MPERYTAEEARRGRASNKSQTEGKDESPENASVYKLKSQRTDKKTLRVSRESLEMYFTLFLNKLDKID